MLLNSISHAKSGANEVDIIESGRSSLNIEKWNVPWSAKEKGACHNVFRLMPRI
jgi:hypothetical protein